MVTDQSKLNLVNLHYKKTNHTIITTTTMVACCIIIIMSFPIKEFVTSRRLKRQRTGSQPKTMRDYPMDFPNSTTWGHNSSRAYSTGDLQPRVWQQQPGSSRNYYNMN